VQEVQSKRTDLMLVSH